MLRFKSRAVAVIAVCCAVAAALFCTFNPLYNHGPLGWGWSYTLLIACAAIANKEIEIPVPHPLVILGDMSYTLYLVHLLIIGGVPVIFRAFDLEAPLHTIAYLVFAVLLSLLLAVALDKFLEQTLSHHAMRCLDVLFHKRTPPSAAT